MNPEDLDPGIREMVLLFQSAGFTTIDSGDGSKAKIMEFALPYPHVFIALRERTRIFEEADRCLAVLRDAGHDTDPQTGWLVGAEYSPLDGIVFIKVERPGSSS